MILEPISMLPEPTKVISLTAARDKYRPGKCKHMRMTVDDELDTVACDDCGEKLNPVAVLVRFAIEETMLDRRRESLRHMSQKLDAKIRCKCQHCGQMTRVRP